MSHDYRPHDDYPVIELDEVIALSVPDRAAIETAIERVRHQLVPALSFADNNVEIFFVEPMGLGGEDVARYCNGTSSRPVVGFDLALLAQICQEEGHSLAWQFECSLAHELAHAYQESIGLDHDHEAGFDEDDAEMFGLYWAGTGLVDLELLDHALPEQELPGA